MIDIETREPKSARQLRDIPVRNVIVGDVVDGKGTILRRSRTDDGRIQLSFLTGTAPIVAGRDETVPLWVPVPFDTTERL